MMFCYSIYNCLWFRWAARQIVFQLKTLLNSPNGTIRKNRY
ncbi:NADH dehydrogenase subunit K [Iris pallida]|uniref:NADH dehydrogenase subunit K (Chloroplast) n=1 Tax=Iris pallida TaxID=29817 RepID=A0AAX6GRU7_IRIPA|nr:NADH dehydrogenase subunit K [Iris pallida]